MSGHGLSIKPSRYPDFQPDFNLPKRLSKSMVDFSIQTSIEKGAISIFIYNRCFVLF